MANEKKPGEEEKKDEQKPVAETPEGEPKVEEKAATESDAKSDAPEAEKPKESAKGEEQPEATVNEGEKTEETAEAAPPELSEIDKVKEENFRLKTQLEAMKIGFNPNVIEDAVVLAENIVKRDGSDISTALQAVAKKYPEWKNDGKSKGSFKVGADSSKQKSTSDEKLNRAFGIKK